MLMTLKYEKEGDVEEGGFKFLMIFYLLISYY